MADLYFKVKADYDELIKMQQEARRLQGELSDAATKSDFTRLASELQKVNDKIQALGEKGAKEFVEIFKKMGDESPEFLKELDWEFMKFSGNVINTFNGMQAQYEAMLKELSEKSNSIELMNAPRLKEQINAVTDEIREQITVLEEQKAMWSGEYDEKNVNALEIIKEQREEEEKKLEVLRQQMEAKRQQAEESTLSRGDKIGQMFVGNNDLTKIHEEDVAAAEKAKQAYEAQIAVVEELKRQEDVCRESLTETAQAQVAEAEATQRTAQEREALAEKLRAEQSAMAETTEESKKTSDALSETSEAMKRLKADDLANHLRLASDELEKLAQKLADSKKELADAEKAFEEAKRAAMKGEGNDADLLAGYNEAKDRVEAANAALEQTASDYNEIKAKMDEMNASSAQSEEHHVRMRTQIMNAREEMMQLIAAGKQGTPEFQQLAMKAGDMRKQMNLANAQMQYFANPNKHFAAMKQGLQGAASAAGVLTGAMGLFNTESEKMQEIQTKVQSVMAIVNGLEQVYATLKQTSVFMLALQEAKTIGVTSAQTAQTAATEGATVAQHGLNAAMEANPFGAIIAVVVALVGVVTALAAALTDASDSAGMGATTAKALEEAMSAQMKTTGEQISTFNKLKKVYDESGGKTDVLTKKILENKEAQKQLGIVLKTVDDIHRLFGKHADDFVKASMMRAQALALETAAAEGLGKTMAEVSKVMAKMRAGKEVNFEELEGILEEAGIKNAYQTITKAGFYKMDAGFLEKDDLDWNPFDKRSIDEKEQALYKSIGDEYMKAHKNLFEEAARLSEDADAQEISFSDLLEKNQVKDTTQKQKTKKTKKSNSGSQVNQTQSEKDDKEYERQESLRKTALEKEKRDLQNQIKVETDAEKKREKQRKLAKIDSEEFFRDMLKKEIAYQKAQYDEKNKNTNNKVSFYKSQEFHKFMLNERDKYNNSMNKLNLKAYENEMAITENIMAMQESLTQRSDFDKSLKALDQFLDKRIQIEKKYMEERAKIETIQKSGAITKEEADDYIKKIGEREQAELKKAQFANLKNSPLFEAAMSNPNMSFTQIKDIRDSMTNMMNEAMSTAEPSDFKGILDSYVKITNVMIEKNPFEVMQSSAREMRVATKQLEDETDALNKLYEDLGTNAAGEDLEGGKLHELKKVSDDAKREQENATKAVEDAQRILAESEEAYYTLSPEEQARQKDTLAQLFDNVTEAINKETEAKLAYNKASQAYYAEKDKVKEQEKKVAKSSQKATAAQNTNTKATKQAMKVVKEWANALKNVASEFESPIATATAGMADLAVTTLDSIDKIKEAGFAAAKGVEKVAIAVQNAVAILAIIQAAWQVINTIMGLFTGKDKEEYEKHISSLKGQVEALDYTFNRLKEDMDNAWGTEAIDAYTKAVETLNEKQAASLELIKAQSNAHFGHHSLDYYQKKESGITSKELQEAKKKIQELGGDVSGEWITDWLYTLTAEQLREFMSSGIGTLIMGKLGGVNGTGDYSGSDWANDMRAYADTAKTIEDLTLEMTEKLNGISLDGLKDEFKSLVTTMTTSLNDINNSFDAFMREAMYNKLRTKYDEQIEDFNEELKDLNDQYNRGQMSDAEYRKRLQELRDRWKRETKAAQDEYQANLTAAGINATDVEQSATSGGFETMSEDTATELNGRFASMQAMETVTAENTMQLVALQTNAVNIADEIRTIQVNSYLELQAISENTKKIYNTMGEMQGDVKSIKENTDKL